MIRCPNCYSGLSKVTHKKDYTIVYRGKKKTINRRIRKCEHCGARWQTSEVNEEDLPEIFDDNLEKDDNAEP